MEFKRLLALKCIIARPDPGPTGPIKPVKKKLRTAANPGFFSILASPSYYILAYCSCFGWRIFKIDNLRFEENRTLFPFIF